MQAAFLQLAREGLGEPLGLQYLKRLLSVLGLNWDIKAKEGVAARERENYG